MKTLHTEDKRTLEEKLIDTFFLNYGNRVLLITPTQTECDHVLKMLHRMLALIHHGEEQREFITACVNSDWHKAAQLADQINFRNLALYILFINWSDEKK